MIQLPPWLEPLAGLLASGSARCPQALLIHGAPGSGRRLLALTHAARLLGIPAERLTRLAQPGTGEDAGAGMMGHPDFVFLQPPPEKSSIAVEAVRELVDFLHLKSHQGGARIAVICPADAMTTAAANGLLKTLEEPPAGSFIMLVASRPASLPATIVSRCQRLAIPTPKRDIAVAWLRAQGGEADWDLLLDVAGGAPLQALALHREDFAAQATRLADDIRQLESGHASPVTVAQRWGGHDAPLLTQWLYRLLAGAIRARAAVAPATARDAPLQTGGKPLTMQALQQRLADVEELRRMGSKAIRMDIQYAALLQRWYA